LVADLVAASAVEAAAEVVAVAEADLVLDMDRAVDDGCVVVRVHVEVDHHNVAAPDMPSWAVRVLDLADAAEEGRAAFPAD
jgi:hypothetical protein